MLVLMRRAGEAIHIGPDIVVTLVTLDRNRARIGIVAPRDISIDREEIALRKRRETRLRQGDAQTLGEEESGRDRPPDPPPEGK